MLFVGIILQHDTKVRLQSAGNDIISFRCIFKLEAMRRERTQIDFPRVYQLLESFHVPLFSPSHVRRGVIDTIFLILQVVTARAIRARHPQFQFLLIPIRISLKASRHSAKHHNAALFAANRSCKIYRVET